MARFKRVLKWLAIAFGGLIAVLAIAIAILYFVERGKVEATFEIEPEPFDIPTDEESVAEGERLYHARMCVVCHGEDAGGSLIADMWAMALAPANLTVVADAFSSQDFARAVRHGVSPSGRAYVHMPADARFWAISDRDLGMIIAYIRTLPPVDHDLPATELRFWGYIFDAVGMVPVPMIPSDVIDHEAPRPPEPEIAETPEFGRYLVQMSGCNFCHGEHLAGGPVPMMPEEDGVPANITPHQSGIAGYTREDFFTLIREQRTRDGRTLEAEMMNFESLQRLTDTEIGAIWAYLETIEPREYGDN